eukprot:6212062-Pleurochrysis_carterae.AAC.1
MHQLRCCYSCGLSMSSRGMPRIANARAARIDVCRNLGVRFFAFSQAQLLRHSVPTFLTSPAAAALMDYVRAPLETNHNPFMTVRARDTQIQPRARSGLTTSPLPIAQRGTRTFSLAYSSLLHLLFSSQARPLRP